MFYKTFGLIVTSFLVFKNLKVFMIKKSDFRLELAQLQGNLEMQHNQTPLQPISKRKHITFDPNDPNMQSEFENLEVDNMDLKVNWLI